MKKCIMGLISFQPTLEIHAAYQPIYTPRIALSALFRILELMDALDWLVSL